MLQPHTHAQATKLTSGEPGYQLIAKKYEKKGVFPVFGIGVAE